MLLLPQDALIAIPVPRSVEECERDTSPVRHHALHPLQRDDRKLSAHGRGASSMRTTASAKRQSLLELAQAVSRLLDRIYLDEARLLRLPGAGGQTGGVCGEAAPHSAVGHDGVARARSYHPTTH